MFVFGNTDLSGAEIEGCAGVGAGGFSKIFASSESGGNEMGFGVCIDAGAGVPCACAGDLMGGVGEAADCAAGLLLAGRVITSLTIRGSASLLPPPPALEPHCTFVGLGPAGATFGTSVIGVG
jgi:hypothetical protein